MAAAIGLAVADVFGFDPQLAEQTSSGRFGLSLAFYVLPALLLLISVPLIWRFPVDSRRQRIITRRLERRQARVSGANELSPARQTTT